MCEYERTCIRHIYIRLSASSDRLNKRSIVCCDIDMIYALAWSHEQQQRVASGVDTEKYMIVGVSSGADSVFVLARGVVMPRFCLKCWCADVCPNNVVYGFMRVCSVTTIRFIWCLRYLMRTCIFVWFIWFCGNFCVV